MTDPYISIDDLCCYLEAFAPTRFAEDWDNVGLLVGDRSQSVQRVMTCLTITPESVAEAVERDAQLIVAHHPLPFRPIQRITTDTTAGGMLLDLIQSKIAVYSPHSSFDSAAEGINQRISENLGLQDIVPLRPFEGDDSGLGAGRMGRLPKRLDAKAWTHRVCAAFRVSGLHQVGADTAFVENVAVACGAAGEFLAAAIAAGCDTFVTGETNFHTCLEAKARRITLTLPGHYASERFALEALAEQLQSSFPGIETWASHDESDPLAWKTV